MDNIRLPPWAHILLAVAIPVPAALGAWGAVALLHIPLLFLGRTALTVLGCYTALTWAGQGVRDLWRRTRPDSPDNKPNP